MLGQKARMVLAAIGALLLSLLLVGISYLLAPNKSSQTPLPIPIPSIINQIFAAILWIALAAVLAIIIIAIAFMINRIKRKKSCEKIDSIPFEFRFKT
jgi:ABC-type antimicrobial peptide transport system permease subunit